MEKYYVILIALPFVVNAGIRERRIGQVTGLACPDPGVGVCRNCTCTPQTARYTRGGLIIVSTTSPADPVCNRCCFVESLPQPNCPADPVTHQQRNALSIVGAVNNYVGCCPFTACQTGYGCMFDESNARYLCCSVGAVVPPTMPPPVVDVCPLGVQSAGVCINGLCPNGYTCTTNSICCPTPPTTTTAPIRDQWGCVNSKALIYRTASGAYTNPRVPVVGCSDPRAFGIHRCPSGTTCQDVAHADSTWLRGLCCVPNGVDQSTIPILTN